MKKYELGQASVVLVAVVALSIDLFMGSSQGQQPVAKQLPSHPSNPEQAALQMIKEGRQTFRHDTFGDESFWGDALKLHHAIIGEKLGGVGPGVSPNTALAVGLRVDVEALPPDLVQKIKLK